MANIPKGVINSIVYLQKIGHLEMGKKTFKIQTNAPNKMDAGLIEWQDKIKDGKGARKSRELLQGIIKQLCIQSMVHWYWGNKNEYYPLTYKERYLYSHFAVAVNKFAEIHLSEHKISRKSRHYEDSAGRVDHWAYFKKMHYFFELKRESFGFEETKWPKKLDNAIESVFKQSKSLKKEIEEWMGTNDNGSLVGMCIVLPSATSTSDRFKLRNKNKENFMEIGDKAAKVFIKQEMKRKTSNIVAVWRPPFNAQFFQNENDNGQNGEEFIPYIGFVAQLTLIRKKY